jgi:hypothetical protein
LHDLSSNACNKCFKSSTSNTRPAASSDGQT